MLVLAGCSDLFGPDGPKLSVAPNLEQPVTPAPVLQADVGRWQVEVRATNSSEGGTEVRGPWYGDFPVRVAEAMEIEVRDDGPGRVLVIYAPSAGSMLRIFENGRQPP